MTMHKMSSVAAAVGLAGLAVLSTAGAAGAAPAPESCAYGMTCPTQISDRTPAPGQRITVTTGAGAFKPGAVVTVTYLGQTATVTAAADGSATVSFAIPAGAKPGPRGVVFTSGGTTVRVPFTVVAGAAVVSTKGGTGATGTGAAGSGTTVRASGLPQTGSDVVGLSVAGLVLVGAGAGAVVVARRRQNAAA